MSAPKNKFYIATSIAYTNAPPHIGFALELVQADVLARYRRLLEEDVFFLTGTDEHGRKVAEAAEKAGKDDTTDEYKSALEAARKLCEEEKTAIGLAPKIRRCFRKDSQI